MLYKVDLSHLREKALQYSSPEQLQAILVQLDELGPLLKRFNMLTLRSFVRELRLAFARTAGQPPEIAAMMTEPLLHQTALLASSLEDYSRDQRKYNSPWQAQMPGQLAELHTVFRDRYLLSEKGTMGFLKVQPAVTSSDFNGSSPSIDRLRELLNEVAGKHPQARLAVTGIPILESDEMRSSQTAMFYASILSFLGVAALMVLGFRGLRYPLLGNLVLLVGMAWSFGFTTLAVGHLNILSVSFAAMLIGIGIDYSTVYLLRYLECRHEGLDAHAAVIETGASVGPGILDGGHLIVGGVFLRSSDRFRRRRRAGDHRRRGDSHLHGGGLRRAAGGAGRGRSQPRRAYAPQAPRKPLAAVSDVEISGGGDVSVEPGDCWNRRLRGARRI